MLTANEILEWDQEGTPPPPDLVLRVDKVFKRFSSRSGLFRRKTTDVRAVDGLSLAISEGERIGIFGPAGCGKTTIRRLITGALKHDAGVMLLSGRPIGVAATRSHTHLIAGGDLTVFNTAQSIEANIATALTRHGLGHADALMQARILLLRTGFASNRITMARRSGLMADEGPRAALAYALATDSRLLVLDEPFAGLSLSRQIELAALVRSISNETDLSCLLLTREPRVAEAIADRMFAMHEGRLTALQSTTL